jgi:hypothetical protein
LGFLWIFWIFFSDFLGECTRIFLSEQPLAFHHCRPSIEPASSRTRTASLPRKISLLSAHANALLSPPLPWAVMMRDPEKKRYAAHSCRYSAFDSIRPLRHDPRPHFSLCAVKPKSEIKLEQGEGVHRDFPFYCPKRQFVTRSATITIFSFLLGAEAIAVSVNLTLRHV